MSQPKEKEVEQEKKLASDAQINGEIKSLSISEDSSKNKLAINLFVQRLASDQNNTNNGKPSLTTDILISGRYKLLQTIGQGAYGNVYKAYYPANDTYRAVKVIKIKHAADPCISREIQMIPYLYRIDSSLAKLYIVQLYHAFQINCSGLKIQFLVYELLGPSLQMILKDNNRIGLPFLQVQKIAHQLVSALIFLHSNSCAHHDLKPDNIAFVSTRFEWNPENNQKMITSSEIKLLDFGSATFKSDKKSFFATTRQYRSPQMECNWSPKNDVWSLGCTLFEILTGKMLFPCVNNIEMIFMVEVLFGNIPLEIGLKLQKLTCFNPDGKLVHDASTRYIRHNIAKDRKIVPFKEIQSQWSHLDPEMPLFYDFILKTLELEDNLRPEAHQLLSHPYLNSLQKNNNYPPTLTSTKTDTD